MLSFVVWRIGGPRLRLYHKTPPTAPAIDPTLEGRPNVWPLGVGVSGLREGEPGTKRPLWQEQGCGRLLNVGSPPPLSGKGVTESWGRQERDLSLADGTAWKKIAYEDVRFDAVL